MGHKPNTFNLEQRQVEELKILSRETNIPQSVYVREGINKVLEENKETIRKAKDILVKK